MRGVGKGKPRPYPRWYIRWEGPYPGFWLIEVGAALNTKLPHSQVAVLPPWVIACTHGEQDAGGVLPAPKVDLLGGHGTAPDDDFCCLQRKVDHITHKANAAALLSPLRTACLPLVHRLAWAIFLGEAKRLRRQKLDTAGNGETVARRVQPYDITRTIPLPEFVLMRCRFHDVFAMKCSPYGALDVSTRHARICHRARGHVKQHQPLVHALAAPFKRLGTKTAVEERGIFTADRDYPVGMFVPAR